MHPDKDCYITACHRWAQQAALPLQGDAMNSESSGDLSAGTGHQTQLLDDSVHPLLPLVPGGPGGET